MEASVLDSVVSAHFEVDRIRLNKDEKNGGALCWKFA
jgi:hypothetical protein